MVMPQCCYLAKAAKRPSHTTNTIKFDRIPFVPCNSIKRFDLCPFDEKNSTYLQPPARNSIPLNRQKKVLKNMAVGIKTIESIQHKFPTTVLVKLFHALIISHFEYSAIFFTRKSPPSLLSLEKQMN